LENKARRAAKKVGLLAKKSRRQISMDNHGGFTLIDPYRNWIVAGERYDLSPDDVIEFCSKQD